MSIVRKLLAQIQNHNKKQAIEIQQCIERITRSAKTFRIQQLQQFIREISHLIYQRQETVQIQIIAITIIKQMLISASFSVYLLSNVYIFPWVISICNFQQSKSLEARAKLLLTEASNQNSLGNKNIELNKRLLILCQQFLLFFGQNFKFHPSSKYKIKSILAKQLHNNIHNTSMQHYSKFELQTLQTNLKSKWNVTKQLDQLADFISSKIQECMQDSSKFHDNLYLFISLIEISQSYCITTTVFRLSYYFTQQHIEKASLIADYIISTAEIQAVESINIRCLPQILQYLLPVSFKQNVIKQSPKGPLQLSLLNKLIDYYYIWYQKCKLLRLSTKIYQQSYGMIEMLKKPFKLSFQSQIKQFKASLQKRQENNGIKRSFIIDQHEEQQQKIVNLLKQAAFCIRSKQVQRQVAYQNVLDDLTITQKDSVSQFSESLIRSLQKRQEASHHQEALQSKKYTGLLHRNKGKQQQIENIYYNKGGKKSLNKASSIPFNKHNHSNRSSRSKLYHQQCQSQKQIKYPTIPIVTSRNSRGIPQSESALSLHSSQFSQKDNRQLNRYNSNKQAQSIYLNKDNSGQFLYFQKQSDMKSQRNEQKSEEMIDFEEEKQIQFKDSLKNINESQSCEVLQYGMDINAKIPPSVSKPKFNFKSQQTDQSMVLKDLSSTPKKQVIQGSLKNQSKKIQSPISVYYQTENQQYKSTPKISNLQINSPRKNNFNSKDLVREKSSVLSQSSIIKQNSAQPHIISQSLSFSNQKLPSKFGEVFKLKSQKASVLSSSRSLKKLRPLPQRQVQIHDFKKLRDLENQLGKLKRQTEQYNIELDQKKKQMVNLQKKRMQIHESDPYYLTKQNQIMKILLNNKGKSVSNLPSPTKILTKELKESQIKNNTMSLKDYNTDVLKLKFQNVKAFTKEERKNIVSNRCILLKNHLIELGYSFKNNLVTLYLTLKNYCESFEINLMQNSLIFSQQIKRYFSKLLVGKQMKFKTQVHTTRDNNKFIPSQVRIKMSYQHKLDVKNEQFSCILPLTPYNIALPLQQNEVGSNISSKSNKTSYITPLYTSSQDLFKKGKQYLTNIFPQGYFSEDGSVFTINYKWKQRIQMIHIKLKQRAFRIEGIGYPLQTGRELIETAIGLLIDSI